MSQEPRWSRVLVQVCRGWALIGGWALVGAALVTISSVARRAAFDAPIPGDIEMVEILVALAAFSFLPFCQVCRGHVMADLFTARAPAGLRALLDMLAAFSLAVVALVLAYALGLGGLSVAAAGEESMVLGLPGWWGYGPGAVSALLLALAAARSAWLACARRERPAA